MPGFSRAAVVSGKRLRAYLRNKLTIAAYKAVWRLAQFGFVTVDCWRFRLRRAPIAEVGCVRMPQAGTAYRRLALLAIFAERLDANHHRVIQGLCRAGYAVAVLNNKTFAEATLPKEVVLVLENQNVGRDIGGYLRGLRFLEARNLLTADAQVLFLNDSVIYLPGHEAVFRAIAAAQHDWVGITESHYSEYHVASWCFALSAAALRSDAFRSWASGFLPLNNRLYLINKGEIGLTRALRAGGLTPHVLFGSERVRSIVDQMLASVPGSVMLVPQRLRRHFGNITVTDALLQTASQMHLLTFAGIWSGRFSFVKKDLLYRAFFDAEDIARLCGMIGDRYGPAIEEECGSTLSARGTGSGQRGMAALRWFLGVD